MNTKIALWLTWVGLAAAVAGYAWAQQGPNVIVGCIYSTNLPTLSNGQVSALQCDANGKLVTTTTH